MAGAAVAVMMRRARQDILRHFLDQGATSPDRAVVYDPGEGGGHARVRRRLFRRMRDYGAVREPSAGRFYLDQTRAEEFRWAQRQRALGLVALGSGIVAAIVALG